MEQMSAVERAALSVLATMSWASDLDIRHRLIGTAADGLWALPLTRALRRRNWIEAVQNPTNDVGRGWRLSDAGRFALEAADQTTEQSLGCTDVAADGTGGVPELAVWTWLEEGPPTTAWVSFERLEQPGAVREVLRSTQVRTVSSWFHRAKQADRLLTEKRDAVEGWPAIALWAWIEGGEGGDVVRVSAVREPGVRTLQVPVPRDVAWARALRRSTAGFAVAKAGHPGGPVAAFAHLVAQEAEARNAAKKATAAQARLAVEDDSRRRRAFRSTGGASVRAISAGAPGLGRRGRR
jgi:hypothetical protein